MSDCKDCVGCDCGDNEGCDSTPEPKYVAYDDFVKFDLRVGTILSAEPVLKSKKLLKMKVSFGSEIGDRTIMGSFAKASQYGEVIDGAWKDSCMIGSRVVAVVNLAPRMMMGVESYGMLLATHDQDDRVWLVSGGPVPDGSKLV